jgi:phosphoglycolate phosphatase-like HAD superfamily hydrolase
LIPLAQGRGRKVIGKDFSGANTVVIGDTTRDVLSAKSSGVRSIAVTTGTDNRKQLKAVEPDLLLDDLRDLDLVIAGILQFDGKGR